MVPQEALVPFTPSPDLRWAGRFTPGEARHGSLAPPLPSRITCCIYPWPGELSPGLWGLFQLWGAAKPQINGAASSCLQLLVRGHSAATQ